MAIDNLFKIWAYVGMLSMLLIPFRPDGKLVFNDLIYLSCRSFFSFIATVILMYIMLPIFLIDTILVIYKNIK